MGMGTINGSELIPITRSYVEWLHSDGVTVINIEVVDETVVERLASELRACGCIVSVYTEEQYDTLDGSLDGMFATAMERHIR
jgi:hypothetical protein